MESIQKKSSKKNRQKGTGDRYLVFTLCGEQYAVGLLKAKEVIALSDVTPVPNMPAHFAGIMNLRGKVISIIDLRIKFSMPKNKALTETSIIILDIAELSLGIIVDSIDNVTAVEATEIQPMPAIDSKIKGDFISGVFKSSGRLVLVLDIERILNVMDLRAMNQQSAKTIAA